MTTRTCPSCARQAHSADDTSPWECPYIDCITRMKRDAADLIKSLQAQLEQANKRIETKETLLRLQETTISMLSSDKDMLIHKLRDAESNLAASQRRAQYARNELCLKCGKYHEAHNGACNGCRWKEI